MSPDATACRQAVLDEGARLWAKAREASESPHLGPEALGRRYDETLATLSASTYLDELKFTEEFNGRALLHVFLEWMGREYKSRLTLKRFVSELERAVPTAYRSNRLLFRSDDFRDLANGVRALAGLPPV